MAHLRTPPTSNRVMSHQRFSGQSPGEIELDRIPNALEQALKLLELNDLQDLEDRFISTEAFLRPWGVFRDTMWLKQRDALPVSKYSYNCKITNMEILRAYTQYDDGEMRYDPEADAFSFGFDPVHDRCGTIDKSLWNLTEHEKLLYAWLLQTFKVGKMNSPHGFEYFHGRTLCRAWREVFLPIVNEVRAAYSTRGKRFYGRLALHIERVSPSRLHFPETNVGSPDLSHKPLPLLPKEAQNAEDRKYKARYKPKPHPRERKKPTKKWYDDTEKELRTVYPMFGGLVERPIFKKDMTEWLDEQRERAELRKALARQEADRRQSRAQIDRNDCSSTTSDSSKLSNRLRQGSIGSLRRYSSNLRRSLCLTLSKRRSKDLQEQPSSPFDDTTYPSLIPERFVGTPVFVIPEKLSDTMPSRPPPSSPAPRPRIQSPVPKMKALSPPRPKYTERGSTFQVYNAISEANPFREESLMQLTQQQYLGSTGDEPSMDTTMLLIQQFQSEGDFRSQPEISVLNVDTQLQGAENGVCISPKKSYNDVRIPSYEGSDYVGEITPAALKALQRSRSTSPLDTTAPPTFPSLRLAVTQAAPSVTRALAPPTKHRSRIPQPVRPVPYRSNLIHVKSYESLTGETYFEHSPSLIPRPLKPNKLREPTTKPVQSPHHAIPWPGDSDSDEEKEDNRYLARSITPPVPMKSPERWRSVRGHVTGSPIGHPLRQDPSKLTHAVSRGNIRAALGNHSRESLIDEFVPPVPKIPDTDEFKRNGSPGVSNGRLQAYNTNLFPRKGTPMNGKANASATHYVENETEWI